MKLLGQVLDLKQAEISAFVRPWLSRSISDRVTFRTTCEGKFQIPMANGGKVFVVGRCIGRQRCRRRRHRRQHTDRDERDPRRPRPARRHRCGHARDPRAHLARNARACKRINAARPAHLRMRCAGTAPPSRADERTASLGTSGDNWRCTQLL
jgi:hypothetical protein